MHDSLTGFLFLLVSFTINLFLKNEQPVTLAKKAILQMC